MARPSSDENFDSEVVERTMLAALLYLDHADREERRICTGTGTGTGTVTVTVSFAGTAQSQHPSGN